MVLIFFRCGMLPYEVSQNGGMYVRGPRTKGIHGHCQGSMGVLIASYMSMYIEATLQTSRMSDSEKESAPPRLWRFSQGCSKSAFDQMSLNSTIAHFVGL